jgi:uncharacterized protein YrzB (UPF0473 family)
MEYQLEEETLKINVDGVDKEYKLLFTFDSEDTMKTYIGYTDDKVAPNGRKNIYVSAISPFKSNNLENITDEKELEMVRDFLEYLDKEAR